MACVVVCAVAIHSVQGCCAGDAGPRGDIIGGEMMVCRYLSISPDKSQLRIWLKTQTLGTICLRCVGRLWRRVWNVELVAYRVGRMVVWSCAPEARSKISQFPSLGNWLAAPPVSWKLAGWLRWTSFQEDKMYCRFRWDARH